MMRLDVIDVIDNYYYVLSNNNKKSYKLNIEFYDIETPKVGDTIYFPNKLLIDNGVYSFGKINDNISDLNDYIVVLSSNKKIYLQRYYG